MRGGRERGRGLVIRVRETNCYNILVKVEKLSQLKPP
jgi:hypothetical protein